MNPNSRTIKVIESTLARLEAAVSRPPAPAEAESAALEALGLLDEIRRLERKWGEQVAAGSPRRKPTDYTSMEGWGRRWFRVANALLEKITAGTAALLEKQCVEVQRDLSSGRFRSAADALRASRSEADTRSTSSSPTVPASARKPPDFR